MLRLRLVHRTCAGASDVSGVLAPLCAMRLAASFAHPLWANLAKRTCHALRQTCTAFCLTRTAPHTHLHGVRQRYDAADARVYRLTRMARRWLARGDVAFWTPRMR